MDYTCPSENYGDVCLDHFGACMDYSSMWLAISMIVPIISHHKLSLSSGTKIMTCMPPIMTLTPYSRNIGLGIGLDPNWVTILGWNIISLSFASHFPIQIFWTGISVNCTFLT